MVLERYRGGFERAFAPVARRALDLGLTPNAVSVASLGLAVLGGVAFYLSSPAAPWLLVLGAAFTAANAIADGLDGRMARLGAQESARGDYLDHVLDRYSDLALLLGLTLSPWGHPIVGLVAIVGTLMTSYMGTQSQALGLGRDYRGLLGRADRVTLLISVPALQGLLAWAGLDLGLGFTLVTAMLAYIAIAGNVTALQRFRSAWKELGERGRR